MQTSVGIITDAIQLVGVHLRCIFPKAAFLEVHTSTLNGPCGCVRVPNLKFGCCFEDCSPGSPELPRRQAQRPAPQAHVVGAQADNMGAFLSAIMRASATRPLLRATSNSCMKEAAALQWVPNATLTGDCPCLQRSQVSACK